MTLERRTYTVSLFEDVNVKLDPPLGKYKVIGTLATTCRLTLVSDVVITGLTVRFNEFVATSDGFGGIAYDVEISSCNMPGLFGVKTSVFDPPPKGITPMARITFDSLRLIENGPIPLACDMFSCMKVSCPIFIVLLDNDTDIDGARAETMVVVVEVVVEVVVVEVEVVVVVAGKTRVI